jgi:XTP/dITP diphosphohydrolase
MNKQIKQKIVLATGNAGKVKEMAYVLEDFGIEVIAQSQFEMPEAIEDGLSFIENAIKKARHAAQYTGLPAIADDSGIEVDALDGRPGIYSARFSGDDATDELNNALLLDSLKGIEKPARTARYQCAIAMLKHAKDPTPQIFVGAWEGVILEAPQGDGGFGYDPLFWVESEQCTAANLTKEQKYAISHRGKAMAKLIEHFQSQVKP